MSKVSNYLCKEFDTIIKDSREYRAYELGMAEGFFQLYKYVELDIGSEKAQSQFEMFFKGKERVYEYFRKLVELDKEPLTKLEKTIEKFEEYKNKSK